MAKGKVLTPLTPLKFKNIRQTGEFINIDEITDNVVYVGHIEQNFGSTIGIPVSVIPGGTYDVVATFACATWRIQLVMSMYNGNIIRRTYYNGAWHEWAKVNMTTVGGVISELLLSVMSLGGRHEWKRQTANWDYCSSDESERLKRLHAEQCDIRCGARSISCAHAITNRLLFNPEHRCRTNGRSACVQRIQRARLDKNKDIRDVAGVEDSHARNCLTREAVYAA